METPIQPNLQPPSGDGDSTPQPGEDVELIPAPVAHSDGTPAPANDNSAKASAFTVSILVHAAILFALAFYVVSEMVEAPPELTVMASELSSNDPEVKKEVFEKMKNEKPAAPSKASNLIAAHTSSPMAIKTMNVDNYTPTFGIGDDFGTGGLGMGAGGGGGAKFFNSTSTGQRFAFIIDVSRSLSEEQFRMIKDELRKSLKRLPSSVSYQVIFFSGPAWFAENKYDTKDDRNGGTIVSGKIRQAWTRGPGGVGGFVPEGGDMKYTAKWLQATKTNLSKSYKDIEDVQKSLGTNWSWPLKLALRLKPKPDVIYFLTDGAVGRADQMVEEVVTLNKKLPGPKAKINTISMMEPQAMEHLGSLAKQTKGKFTIVDRDGSTREPRVK